MKSGMLSKQFIIYCTVYAAQEEMYHCIADIFLFPTSLLRAPCDTSGPRYSLKGVPQRALVSASQPSFTRKRPIFQTLAANLRMKEAKSLIDMI